MTSVYIVFERYDGRKRVLGVYEERGDAEARVDDSLDVDFDDGTWDYTDDRGVYGGVGHRGGPLYGYWVEKRDVL